MTVKRIPLSRLRPHPHNRTVDVDCEEFRSLRDGIGARIDQGLPLLINLPVVRPLKDDFQIICGHRRILALRELGVRDQNCTVLNLDDREALQRMALDNAHRQDLCGVEILDCVQRMKAEGLTNSEIGNNFGHSAKWAANVWTLRNLPPEVQDEAREKRLTLGAMAVKLLKPGHGTVHRPLMPNGIQIVRGWKLRPSGCNHLLTLEVYGPKDLTRTQLLKHLGL